MSHEIVTHADAGVLTVSINRPERKNSITAAMYAALADASEDKLGAATANLLGGGPAGIEPASCPALAPFSGRRVV
jgi:hypothetical protein